MSCKKTNVKSLLTRTTLTLIGVAGLCLLVTWLISTPTSSASGGPLALQTFQSPIGDPQLRVVKTVDTDPPQPGDEIVYTLTYSATDPLEPNAAAFNARLYDFLPAGVEYVSSSGTYLGNRTLLFTALSVTSTNQVETVQVRVLEGYEKLLNHAMLAADFVDPAYGSLLTSVEQSPQWLSLTKDGDAVLLPGGELLYTLRYENPGSISVNDVTVMDVLPTGATLVSASPSPDVVTLPVLSWSLGDLAPGEFRYIFITTTAPTAAGIITNTALVDARQRVITQTTFATQIITQGAILRLNKYGSATVIDVGDELVYTLQYENIGNQTATGVVLTDTLPPYVTVTGESTPTTSTPPGQLVWDIGQVISNTQGEIVFTVTVNGGWGEMLHNVADITASYGFPDSSDWYTDIRLAILYLPIVTRNY
jgi:uncharacterized repeat protein (TIGR01451 family)